MPLISVSAHDVDAAGLGLDAELPPHWLEAELHEAAITARPPAAGGPAGRVTARLSRTGDEIVVRGRVRASLSTPCARCTEPAALDVDTEMTLLLKPAAPAGKPGAARAGAAKPKHPKAVTMGETPKPPARPVTMGETPKPPARPVDEYEFTAAEADVDTYDGETVVLDPFVREAILLEVPNFPLCSEGCPGIRPAAGAAPAEAAPPLDPRLSPLAALRAKLSGGGNGVSPVAPGDAPPGAPRPKKKNKE